jgi:hypothetical protein
MPGVEVAVNIGSVGGKDVKVGITVVAATAGADGAQPASRLMMNATTNSERILSNMMLFSLRVLRN